MLLLLLADGNAFRNLPGKQGVFRLGTFLTPLHQLYREGKAQDPGNEGIFQNLCLFRLHFQAGVLHPHLVVGLFLPGQPQKGLFIFFALGKGSDFFVNDTFRQLILLHLLDDGQSCGGDAVGHGKSLLETDMQGLPSSQCH